MQENQGWGLISFNWQAVYFAIVSTKHIRYQQMIVESLSHLQSLYGEFQICQFCWEDDVMYHLYIQIEHPFHHIHIHAMYFIEIFIFRIGLKAFDTKLSKHKGLYHPLIKLVRKHRQKAAIKMVIISDFLSCVCINQSWDYLM